MKGKESQSFLLDDDLKGRSVGRSVRGAGLNYLGTPRDPWCERGEKNHPPRRQPGDE